jgi:hypothetical protein
VALQFCSTVLGQTWPWQSVAWLARPRTRQPSKVEDEALKPKHIQHKAWSIRPRIQERPSHPPLLLSSFKIPSRSVQIPASPLSSLQQKSPSPAKPSTMVKKQEPSTPAAASRRTRWKGRLRSHYGSPLSSLSPWTRSRSRIRDEDKDARRCCSSCEQVTPKTPGTGRRCPSCEEDDGGSVRRHRRVLARRSPRSAGQDPERPIVLDEANEVGVKPALGSRYGLDCGYGM